MTPAVAQGDLALADRNAVVPPRVRVGSPVRVGQLPVELGAHPHALVDPVCPNPEPTDHLSPLQRCARQPVPLLDIAVIPQLQRRLDALGHQGQQLDCETTAACVGSASERLKDQPGRSAASDGRAQHTDGVVVRAGTRQQVERGVGPADDGEPAPNLDTTSGVPVDPDAAGGGDPATMGDRHVDDARRAVGEPVDVGGGVVAQRSVAAAVEQSRPRAGAPGQGAGVGGEDSAVQPLPSAGPHLARDPVGIGAEADALSGRDRGVLARRERRDLGTRSGH